MSGNTKVHRNHLKTQANRYMIQAGVFLCLLVVAAFAIGSKAKGGMAGYAVLTLGAAFFLFTLGFLRKMTQNISDSLIYLEQKFEKFAKGDFSEQIEGNANLVEDCRNLAEYAEIMRQNADNRQKESERETAAFLESIEKLSGQIDRLQQQMTDTSESTGEIAAFMEEITASAEEIDRFSKEVQTSVDHSASQMKENEEEIQAISVRADGIRDEALKRRQIVRHRQLEVKDSFSRSLKGIQAIEEISNLAETIMEMTEKTNMLSLNASIEAAKAGQAGNGFSIVADEIRKLADQSKKKVEEIQWISSEAHYAIDSLKTDSGQLLDFVDSKIISDFDFFLDMADVYGNDADNMKSIAEKLGKTYQELSSSMESILEAVGQIDKTAKDSLAKTTDLTENAAGMAENADSVIEDFKQAERNIQNLKNL